MPANLHPVLAMLGDILQGRAPRGHADGGRITPEEMEAMLRSAPPPPTEEELARLDEEWERRNRDYYLYGDDPQYPRYPMDMRAQDDLNRELNWLRPEGGRMNFGLPPRFADGGPVPPNLLLQTPVDGEEADVLFPQYTDWYQRLYGPFARTSSDALPLNAIPPWLAATLGLDPAYQFPGGVGSTASGGGPGTSGPSAGVNSTSNSAGMAAVSAAMSAAAAMSGMPGLGIASTIANMAAPNSTISVPGIATVDEAVPGISVADALANVQSQTANAVAAGTATGNNAGQPGQANQPGQAPNVGPTPGIGMATQTAQQSDVGGGPAATGQSADPTAGPGDDSTDGGAWARGGYLGSLPGHLSRRKSSHRPIIRRAGLGYVT